MAEISTILWDVGGVLLTNGWDTQERAAVLKKFQLDAEPFEQRHDVDAEHELMREFRGLSAAGGASVSDLAREDAQDRQHALEERRRCADHEAERSFAGCHDAADTEDRP